MSEADFSKQVKKFIEEKLKESEHSSVKVAERVNILNSLTVGKIKKDWGVVFGFLEQDIILFQDEININDIKNDRIIIPRGTKDKKIVIPLAVCELKIGENLNTHHFITYSHIAKELKSVFPHCSCYFISSGQKRNFGPETLLRHTKEFDRVFLDWEKDKEQILKNLLAHLDYLKELKLLE